MPQNLIDTPADWQDVIAVPAPGEPAAMANDPAKPHSLFHALTALAKRTRWLRGALESQLNHNHDDRYAPLNHHHDDRYYTKTEVDARRAQWATLVLGSAGTFTPYVSLTANIPEAGNYLLEGHATWSSSGPVDWWRRFWVNSTLVFDRTTRKGGLDDYWIDKVVVSISSAGSYSFQYAVHGIDVYDPAYNEIYHPTWLGDILLRVSRA